VKKMRCSLMHASSVARRKQQTRHIPGAARQTDSESTKCWQSRMLCCTNNMRS
jgi:hypothetical protein